MFHINADVHNNHDLLRLFFLWFLYNNLILTVIDKFSTFETLDVLLLSKDSPVSLHMSSMNNMVSQDMCSICLTVDTSKE